MIRSSKKIAVVSIAEKFGSAQKIKISDISEIDYVISELPYDNPMMSSYVGSEKPIVL